LVRNPGAKPAAGSSSAARICSTPPYRAISRAAVFSPTPGTPGRPSLGSPRIAAKSAYHRAGTPYFFSTTALSLSSSLATPRPQYSSRVPRSSSTSWNRSRSPETTSTGAGWVAASVPSTSSASYPSTPNAGMPTASSTSSSTGICFSSAFGTSSTSPCATRCFLYEGTSSTRHRGRQDASSAHTTRSGFRVRTSWAIMSMKPRIALTGSPAAVRAAFSGMPWKARK
jgi:hypothetical protein